MKQIENDTTDYSQFLVYKDIEPETLNRLKYYTRLPDDNPNKIRKITTPRGKALYKKDVLKVFNPNGERKQNGTPTPNIDMGYKIDLSSPSRMNCLYKRIASMNKFNKDYCEAGRFKLTKYVAQDGYLYVNLKDYCKPQIKMLAKKLECKEHEVVACLYDLLHKLYLKQKGEFVDDTEPISDET